MKEAQCNRDWSELVASAPSEVQVFLRGALVRRVGRVSLKEGKNLFYVSGLGSGADKDNIRLFFSDPSIRGNVQVSGNTPVDAETGQYEKDALEFKKKMGLHHRKETEKLSQIKALEKYREKLPDSALPVADVLSFLETVPEKLHILYEELARIQEEGTGLQKQQKELNEVSEKIRKKKNSPCMMIEAFAKQDCESYFAVEYMDRQASWTPSYEVMADPAAKRLVFRLRGKIVQTTDEAWQQVKVRLSTSMPQSLREHPDLSPLFLELMPTAGSGIKTSFLREPTGQLPLYGGNFDTAEAFLSAPLESPGRFENTLDPDGGFLSVPEDFSPVQPDEAEVVEQTVTREYVVPGLQDIDSSPEGNIVDLQQFEAAPEFGYYAYPGCDDHAFIVARLDQKPAELVLSGKGQVYFENTLVGSAYIDAGGTDQNFEMSFGTDPQIRVSRKLIRKNVSIVSFRNLQRVSYEFEYTVENQKESVIKTSMFAQIPICSDSRIKIENTSLNGGELSAEDGVVEWRMTLPAKMSESRRLSYDITYPKGETLKPFVPF